MNSERSLFAPDSPRPLAIPPPSTSYKDLLARVSENAERAQGVQDIPIPPSHAQTSLARPSFVMWKNIPTEAERKLLDAQYPKGWYIDRFERVRPLGKKEQDAGLTPGVIASLWQSFPGGWHLGSNYSIYACPGVISACISLTAQQAMEILQSGNFVQEFDELVYSVRHTLPHTIKQKSFSAALTEMSVFLEDNKYPLSEKDARALHARIQEVLAVFPTYHIPKNNDRVPQKISHYVELYISLRRMKTILEKKPLSH